MAKYVKLLDIRKVDTKFGPKAKLQLGKGVEFYFEGKKVDLGEYSSVFLTNLADKTSFLERMVDEGKMKRENVDKELKYFEDKNISSMVEIKIED